MNVWEILEFCVLILMHVKGSNACNDLGECPHRRQIITALQERSNDVFNDVFMSGEFSAEFKYTPFDYYEAILEIAMGGDVLKGVTKAFSDMHITFVENLRTRCKINVNSKLEERIAASFEAEFEAVITMYTQFGGQIGSCPSRPEMIPIINEAMENGKMNLSDFLQNTTSEEEFGEFRDSLSTFKSQIDANKITDVKQVVEQFKKFDKDFRDILQEKCNIPLYSKRRLMVISEAIDGHREEFVKLLSDSSPPHCENRTSLVNEITGGYLSISFIKLVEGIHDFLNKYQELKLSDIKSIYEVMKVIKIASLTILEEKCHITVRDFQMDAVEEFFFRAREQLVHDYLEAGGAPLSDCPNRQAIMMTADYGVPPNHLIAGYTEFEDVATQIKDLENEGTDVFEEVINRVKKAHSAFQKVMSDVCSLDIPGYATDNYFDSLVDSVCYS